MEAREKLKDYLPPFWAAMLRLSGKYKELQTQNIPIRDLENECDNIIDITVRPLLIDIKNKMIRERKDWFHKIITPIENGLKIFAAKPPITTADLITTGISAGTNVALDIIKPSREVDEISKQSGMTFLIKLDELIRNKESNGK